MHIVKNKPNNGSNKTGWKQRKTIDQNNSHGANCNKTANINVKKPQFIHITHGLIFRTEMYSQSSKTAMNERSRSDLRELDSRQ